MSQQGHSERAHALLGASKAAQWINCPPSARLQESVPDKRSEFADEGTAAHEYSELIMRRQLLPCDSKERAKLDASKQYFIAGNPYYGSEMEDAVESYVETVHERFMAALARTPDAVLLLEERLDFSEWVPDGFGTGDVVIIADGIMEIVDLKMGKGVPVSAIGNSQMKLYALGAWSAYNYLYDIREIRMTIVQPRLDSVSSDVIAVDELLGWAESVVKPAAALADAGEGEHKPGEHCRWCKVKATCRARADENMAALAYEFQDPRLMTLEEIGNILYIVDQLKKWAADVEAYAFEQAKDGADVPRWKLVEGRSDRKITDIEAAKVKLVAAGFEESKLLKDPVLRGIGELEKLVGKKKFAELLDGIVIKPPGKPALVPETDPRPQMNSVEKDFAGEGFD